MAAVTLKDIANVTGFSEPTVRQILGNRAHKFSTATRQQVEAAARELGYRPNAAARAARTGRFGCVALLLSNRQMQNTPAGDLLAGIHDELAERNLHLIVAKLPVDDLLNMDWNSRDDAAVPKVLRELMADGLLLTHDDALPTFLSHVQTTPTPMVWINERRMYDAVFPDDVMAGRIATERLLELGHKRIAFVRTNTLHFSAIERYEGYVQAMRAAGLPPLPPHGLQGVTQIQHGGYESDLIPASQWLTATDRPTGLALYNSFHGSIAHLAAISSGLRVPEDISLILCDDYLSGFSGVEMTSVILPRYQEGRIAVQMLVNRIKSPDQQMLARRLPVTLHEGQTTHAPPEKTRPGILTQ